MHISQVLSLQQQSSLLSSVLPDQMQTNASVIHAADSCRSEARQRRKGVTVRMNLKFGTSRAGNTLHVSDQIGIQLKGHHIPYAPVC
jgi:hypothetical protein